MTEPLTDGALVQSARHCRSERILQLKALKLTACSKAQRPRPQLVLFAEGIALPFVVSLLNVIKLDSMNE